MLNYQVLFSYISIWVGEWWEVMGCIYYVDGDCVFFYGFVLDDEGNELWFGNCWMFLNGIQYFNFNCEVL